MQQAAWRAKHDVSVTKQYLALKWQHQFGQHGEKAPRFGLRLDCATLMQDAPIC